MIIPRQYFNQQTPQAQMQQAPMTQAPQRGTANTGRAKAEESLFESMEGLFAKLGGVAAKVEKSNREMEFQQHKQIQSEQTDRELDDFREQVLPSWEITKLNANSVIDYFKEGEKGPQWGTAQKLSKDDKTNRRLQVELKAQRQQAIRIAVSAMNTERNDRAVTLMTDGVTALSQKYAAKLFQGGDGDPEGFVAAFNKEFEWIKKDGFLGKDRYNTELSRIRAYFSQIRATRDFGMFPDKMSELTWKEVVNKYTDAAGIGPSMEHLFPLWQANVNAKKTNAYVDLKGYIQDPSVRPFTSKEMMKIGQPLWDSLKSEHKKDLNRLQKQKENSWDFQKTLLYLRADINNPKAGQFAALVTLDVRSNYSGDGKYTWRPNAKNIETWYPIAEQAQQVMTLVQQYIDSKESRTQKQGVIDSEKIINKINDNKIPIDEIQNELDTNIGIGDKGRIQLQGFIDQRKRLDTESRAERIIKQNLNSEEKKQTFITNYDAVMEGGSPKEGVQPQNDQQKAILNADLNTVSDLYRMAKGDARALVQAGDEADIRLGLSKVRSVADLDKILGTLKDRTDLDPTFKKNQLAILHGARENYEKIEKVETDRKTNIRQANVSLGLGNKIKTSQDPKTLLTDKEIKDADITDNQRLYLTGIRDLKKIQLETQDKGDADSLEAAILIGKAIKSEIPSDARNLIQTAKTKITNPLVLQNLENKLLELEKGLRLNKEDEGRRIKEKNQSELYADLDRQIQTKSSDQDLASLSTEINQLVEEVNPLQKIALELRLELKKQAVKSQKSTKEAKYDNEQDRAYDARIREQIDNHVQKNDPSKSLKPIIDELFNKEKVTQRFPEGEPAWYINLRSHATQSRTFLRKGEQKRGLIKHVRKNWKEYLGMTETQKKAKWNLLFDFDKADTYASKLKDQHTPDPYNSAKLTYDLDTYTNYLRNQIYNPNTNLTNPLNVSNHEGHSLGERLGSFRSPFDKLKSWQERIRLNIESVVRMIEPKTIEDAINALSKEVGKDMHKEKLFKVYLDIATERLEDVRTDPGGTEADDIISAKETGAVINSNFANSSKERQIDYVHDGDTLFVDGVKFRLGNVDTKELGRPDQAGEATRDALREYLKNRKVRMEVYGTGEFGRPLVYIFTDDGLMVNKWLIDHGHSEFIGGFGGGKYQKRLSSEYAQ